MDNSERKLVLLAVSFVLCCAAIGIGVIGYDTDWTFRQVNSKVGAPTVTWEKFTADIEAEQATLLAKYGDYVQVSDDGRLLYKDQVVNENRFKNKIPPNTSIIPYDGPQGKGFQIEQRYTVGTSTWVRSFAIGPEAASRTYDVEYVEPNFQ